MKRILAYILIIPYAIRASYLAAYRESRRQNKFVYKLSNPEFFTTKTKAIAKANKKGLETGAPWHVVEAAPDKFVSVSNKYLRSSGLKSVYQSI
ncbi:hypothetical protein [Mariniphaga sediminis]|uniref:hypothetical protein n=1 Tax=Mariniphaga sediminis TaxID=1628158 RepID=UPI003562C104